MLCYLHLLFFLSAFFTKTKCNILSTLYYIGYDIAMIRNDFKVFLYFSRKFDIPNIPSFNFFFYIRHIVSMSSIYISYEQYDELSIEEMIKYSDELNKSDVGRTGFQRGSYG